MVGNSVGNAHLLFLPLLRRRSQLCLSVNENYKCGRWFNKDFSRITKPPPKFVNSLSFINKFNPPPKGGLKLLTPLEFLRLTLFVKKFYLEERMMKKTVPTYYSFDKY